MTPRFPPELTSRYSLVKPLAQGGFGTVFLVKNIQLGRLEALKLLKAEALDGPRAVDRFINEGRIAASLRHENIVTVYAFGVVAGDLPWLSYEYLDGRSLRRLLSKGRMDWRAALEMGLQLCDALKAAHDVGIIHRDIKPENVLQVASGPYKITDFGIAKGGMAMNTQQGLVLGSPPYLAPEQIKGDPVGPPTDLYALGIVLFESLTDRLPFGGDTPAIILTHHLRSAPPMVRSLRPELPFQLDPLLLKAMAKDPAERFSDAMAFADAMRDVLDVLSGVPNPRVGADTNRRKVTTAEVAVVVPTRLTHVAVSSEKPAPSRWRLPRPLYAVGLLFALGFFGVIAISILLRPRPGSVLLSGGPSGRGTWQLASVIPTADGLDLELADGSGRHHKARWPLPDRYPLRQTLDLLAVGGGSCDVTVASTQVARALLIPPAELESMLEPLTEARTLDGLHRLGRKSGQAAGTKELEARLASGGLALRWKILAAHAPRLLAADLPWAVEQSLRDVLHAIEDARDRFDQYGLVCPLDTPWADRGTRLRGVLSKLPAGVTAPVAFLHPRPLTPSQRQSRDKLVVWEMPTEGLAPGQLVSGRSFPPNPLDEFLDRVLRGQAVLPQWPTPGRRSTAWVGVLGLQMRRGSLRVTVNDKVTLRFGRTPSFQTSQGRDQICTFEGRYLAQGPNRVSVELATFSDGKAASQPAGFMQMILGLSPVSPSGVIAEALR